MRYTETSVTKLLKFDCIPQLLNNYYIKIVPDYFFRDFRGMKLNSCLYKGVLVANLLLASTIVCSANTQAEMISSSENYHSKCSFYGQNQSQAETVGCSIKQSSDQIIINWDDGLKTNLISTKDGGWKSMPSEAKAQVRFYAGTGRVAHVEIFAGPGKGIILVNP